MRHEIFGDTLPAVTIHLDVDECIYTQSGGLTWMSSDILMETNMKGGLLKGLGRAITGQSMFMVTYTAKAAGQSITIASTFPGHIVALDIGKGSIIAQKSAFLCAQPTVTLEVATTGAKGGILGGEGMLRQKLSGSGLAFLEIDGSVKEVKLADGEKLKVQNGNVAAYEETVKYSVEMVKGFSNVLFGGEGLFLTTLEGPGKVYLQTMTVSTLAERIVPFLPTKK